MKQYIKVKDGLHYIEMEYNGTIKEAKDFLQSIINTEWEENNK